MRSQAGPPLAVRPDRSPHVAAGPDPDRVELQQPRLGRGAGEGGRRRRRQHAGEEGPGRGQQQSRRQRLFSARRSPAAAAAAAGAASPSAGEGDVSPHTAAGKTRAPSPHRIPAANSGTSPGMERLTNIPVYGCFGDQRSAGPLNECDVEWRLLFSLQGNQQQQVCVNPAGYQH